ncbi:MAG TPA: FGGY family carbohydrate kinase [Pseudonocardiaceae bacterium]|jgi:xylulokinase|nr:FGGY family carbohydrate kinase [Pseudonocardiaceae bacterium]
MSSTPAFLGIDLGTSSVKAIVLDSGGVPRGEAHRDYPVRSPWPGTAETDPADWWSATCEAVREAVANLDGVAIQSVAVGGQMHGLVLAKADGTPLRDALTWADSRAASVLSNWRRLPKKLRATLANPIAPGMTGPMLDWVRRHQPELVAASRWAFCPKDWLRMRLTGEAATDPSDASATLLWDVPGDRWASDVLVSLDLPYELLPPVIESGQPAGTLLPAAAEALGLPAGIPVAAGAGDTAASVLAARLSPEETMITVGTGAQAVQLRAEPTADPRPITQLYRAAAPALWYEMGAVQNAGIALDWVRAALTASWDDLYAALADGIPESGPVFVPYLTGERTPVLDDRVRGGWAGIDLAHGRADLLRAALIGVVCGIRHALESLGGEPPSRVVIGGGGTGTPAMRQLMADVFGVPVAPLVSRNVSANGAALLAAQAADATLELSSPTEEPIVPGKSRDAAEASYQRYLAEVNRLTA